MEQLVIIADRRLMTQKRYVDLKHAMEECFADHVFETGMGKMCCCSLCNCCTRYETTCAC